MAKLRLQCGGTGLVEILVAVWLCLFVASRVRLFVYGMSLAAQGLEDSRAMAETCLNHPAMRRIEADMCRRHMAKQNMALYWLAVEYVIDNTYLCGYDTCGNVFGGLFVQVGHVAAVTVLVLAVLGSLLVYCMRRNNYRVAADDYAGGDYGDMYRRPVAWNGRQYAPRIGLLQAAPAPIYDDDEDDQHLRRRAPPQINAMV